MPFYTESFQEDVVVPQQFSTLDIQSVYEDGYTTSKQHGLPNSPVLATTATPETREVVDPMFLTRYSITLTENELPVIGTYVDKKITPGFFYRVRKIESNSYLFKGEARQLLSVGMGYGKRITFRGDKVLDNSEFYFYSDTEHEGFAFIPCIPEETKKFTMIDQDGRQIAELKVTSMSNNNIQISCEVTEEGVTQTLNVGLSCNIHFNSSPGGLVSLQPTISDIHIMGIATLTRGTSARDTAQLIKIDNVNMSPYGVYSLLPHSV